MLRALKTPSIRMFVGRFTIKMSISCKRRIIWRPLEKRGRPDWISDRLRIIRSSARPPVKKVDDETWISGPEEHD